MTSTEGSTRRCGRPSSPSRPRLAAWRIKELEREVRELRKTNEILKLASAYFAQAELDRHHKR
jgi:transposase-like protein